MELFTARPLSESVQGRKQIRMPAAKGGRGALVPGGRLPRACDQIVSDKHAIKIGRNNPKASAIRKFGAIPARVRPRRRSTNPARSAISKDEIARMPFPELNRE